MTSLQIGDTAPNFQSFDEAGNSVSLADYNGKKLVLFFYPKASTPGCTAEACDLSDNYTRFTTLGYDVLGVSADSAKRQINFKKKYGLPIHCWLMKINLLSTRLVFGDLKSLWVRYMMVYIELLL